MLCIIFRHFNVQQLSFNYILVFLYAVGEMSKHGKLLKKLNLNITLLQWSFLPGKSCNKVIAYTIQLQRHKLSTIHSYIFTTN